jgi:poly(3-hydroxybutyrate) depolymerase
MRIPALLFCALSVFGQQAPPRPVPPPGVAVPADVRTELQASLDRLAKSIAALKNNPLLPDVLVFHKAVRFALEGNEFFNANEFGKARAALQEGQARADALARGEAPWTKQTGLVVRAYISKIDGSVQPYGLVIPTTWYPTSAHRFRLDAWFHGRGETLSEVNFIADRMKNPGEFQPPDTIVLHLYGRYCNANKFAGEVDYFEALEDVKKHYHIDENRLLARGFSMGGASVWHFATHYGMWAAAAPGAGFAETREFTHVDKQGPKPTWYEEKLWHLYDATDYAGNLYQVPVVAYNGDKDAQRQAADIMERAMTEEGLRLSRVWGPDTAHKYHPDSKVIISRAIDAIADRGSNPNPRRVKFTTWTLAYNRMKWVMIDAMGHEWERARVDAEVTNDRVVTVQTSNVTALTLDMGPGANLLDVESKPTVAIDGQKVTVRGPMTDRSWTVHLIKKGTQWVAGELDAKELRKRHGLQGPIDDAFMDSFLMVSPTGTPTSAGVGTWCKAEEEHAIREWRRQLRGEARVKDDAAVTDADIAAHNLVLWGDPRSNSILAKIADKLPVKWSSLPANAALVMIYPNPLNPKKYVVLNSGHTFREVDNLNNARQVAKLPDFAIIDTTTPPDGYAPGKVLDAGFFGEKWELQARK